MRNNFSINRKTGKDNISKNYPLQIPKWYNQPHYVEVWIEKDALRGTFRKISERW